MNNGGGNHNHYSSGSEFHFEVCINSCPLCQNTIEVPSGTYIQIYHVIINNLIFRGSIVFITVHFFMLSASFFLLCRPDSVEIKTSVDIESQKS